MNNFQSIYRRFSTIPSEDEDEADPDAVENVDNLWPSPPQGIPHLAMAEELKSDPINTPDIKHNADTLMHDFLQRCVEIAVGQQVKAQVLKTAKDRLDAAVNFHDNLRKDYLDLCHAVAKVSTLRPWYRSEKRLAEGRIEVDAKRGPVREDHFWAAQESSSDDDSFQEKSEPIVAKAVAIRWDERTMSLRSFRFVPWDIALEDDGSDGWSSVPCATSPEYGLSSSVDIARSTESMGSGLQSDLDTLSSNNEDGSVSHTQTTSVHTVTPWPSARLAKSDRNQIRRLCEQYVDPRRSSLSPEDRASIKESMRESNYPVSHLWEKIRHAQADHNLPGKDNVSKVALCAGMIQTITEIEVAWELHKETTASERNRAQILVLKLQWDLNGSQRLKMDIDANLANKRQIQMDLWQDIVCAAALRETPVMEETNIFGSVECGSEEADADGQAQMLTLLSPGAIRKRSREHSHPIDPEELFGPMESDLFGAVESERPQNGLVRDKTQSLNPPSNEESRTTRLDSGGPSREDFDLTKEEVVG